MTSTHTAGQPLTSLPIAARRCHIFPHLASGSLLSIGQLCDHGCQALFTATHLVVTLHNTTILTGYRSGPYGHWLVTLSSMSSPCDPPPSLASTNAIAPIHSTIANRIAFYHAILFSPVISTWCAAIDAGHLASWPELTSTQVHRHFPRSIPMHLGHMDQTRANLQSTKVPAHPARPPASDISPPPISDRTNTVFGDLHEATGQVHSDRTGRYTTTSSSGNSYLMIVYDYNSNFIHANALSSRSGPCILGAYQAVHALCVQCGLRPRLQCLDNEASRALLQFMEDEAVDVQLAPPYIHRRNAAECAIRTFKNHLIAGLCLTDPDFPMKLWGSLLTQVIQSLILLHTSQLHPHLSAYAHVHGLFDYNRTPLAPPGIKLLIHEKPAARGTWAPYAVPGWYLGPAMNHYRCYRVWSRSTRAERITDTLKLVPTTIRMPIPSHNELVTRAAQDLTTALLCLLPLCRSRHFRPSQPWLTFFPTMLIPLQLRMLHLRGWMLHLRGWTLHLTGWTPHLQGWMLHLRG
jgi:hypothetical protein